MSACRKGPIAWSLVALVCLGLAGGTAGCMVGPQGPRFRTLSPDGRKEFYINCPVYRRILKGVLYPIEWPVSVATFVFAGSPVGSLYLPDYSLYVHDLPNGRCCRYSANWSGVWSPDSRWIACSAPKSNDSFPLLLIDTVARNEQVVENRHARPNYTISGIVWADDGTALFFRQGGSVYAVAMGSRSIVRIARDQEGYGTPDIVRIGEEWKADLERDASPSAERETPRSQ